MSMRMLLGMGVMTMISACGGRQQPQPPPADGRAPPPPPPLITCPDPLNCTTNSNGTGIYTAEHGKAGIGPHQLMVTHFSNRGSPVAAAPLVAYPVSFSGRYFDDAGGTGWQETTGSVISAGYQDTTMRVLAVTETATTLQWTLLDPRTGTPVAVGGELSVNIAPNLGTNGTDLYALHIKSRPAPPPPHNPRVADKRVMTTYDLSWTRIGGPISEQPYCLDAQGNTDAVVFQQGIAVDSLSGHVTRSADTTGIVTMSCWLGAPATVYSWGYDYRGAPGAPSTETYYFDAGIQMKRASYCGNAQFFTVAGTKIFITDSAQIQPATPRLEDVEAWWSPAGAICLNPARMRHRGMGFSGSCLGVALPPCPISTDVPASSPPYLYDAPEQPAP